MSVSSHQESLARLTQFIPYPNFQQAILRVLRLGALLDPNALADLSGAGFSFLGTCG